MQPDAGRPDTCTPPPGASPHAHAASLTATARDGTPIGLRWYTKNDTSPGSAVLYAHGGGMAAGDLDIYDPVLAAYVDATARG
ncbi:hypothetical protein ACH427_30855 [Streptomyces sp. NPDC020379]|uniref:hypothetical protein n=1 Tax=Streptomyces sp. NPDC020379 TaxID=3365071 RepID=UPI0037B9D380